MDGDTISQLELAVDRWVRVFCRLRAMQFAASIPADYDENIEEMIDARIRCAEKINRFLIEGFPLETPPTRPSE